MAFARKIAASQKKQLYKICERTASGEKVWFVVRIPKEMRDAFLSITKGQDYQVADYGTILAWGYGDISREELTRIVRTPS